MYKPCTPSDLPTHYRIAGRLQAGRRKGFPEHPNGLPEHPSCSIYAEEHHLLYTWLEQPPRLTWP